jgi:hypothetical protein
MSSWLAIGSTALALALTAGCGRGAEEVTPFGAEHLGDPEAWAGCKDAPDPGACGVEQCERYLAQESVSDEDGVRIVAACEHGSHAASQSALLCAASACRLVSAQFPESALELMKSSELVWASEAVRAALASSWVESEERLVRLLEAALAEETVVGATMVLGAAEKIASPVRDWETDALPPSWPRASALARQLVRELPPRAASHVFGLKMAAVLDWEATVPLLIESFSLPERTAVSTSTAAEALRAIHRFGVPEHSREAMLTHCRTHTRYDLASVCVMMLDEATD